MVITDNSYAGIQLKLANGAEKKYRTYSLEIKRELGSLML